MCACVGVCLCVRTRARVCAHGRMQRLGLDPNLLPLGVLLSAGGVALDPEPHKVQALSNHVGWGPPIPIPGLPCAVGRPRPPRSAGGAARRPLPAGPDSRQDRPAPLSLPTGGPEGGDSGVRGEEEGQLPRPVRAALCLKPPLTECGVPASGANKPLFKGRRRVCRFCLVVRGRAWPVRKVARCAAACGF